ncbi:MAG: START domain-containing protein [Myxococcota bacterium]
MLAKLTPSVLLTALLLASGPAAADQADWERVADTDGIRVYAREVEGSRVREIKAVGRVAAPPGRVLAVLTDIEAYTETMPYTEEARVVRRQDNSTWMYTVINPPLVSRRDYCVRITVSRLKNGTLKSRWVPANELAPAESPGVRVEVNEGHWLLRPIEGGQATMAEYYIYTDPGGEVPTFVANRANRSAVPNVVKAVREAAASPRYANAMHPLAQDSSGEEEAGREEE